MREAVKALLSAMLLLAVAPAQATRAQISPDSETDDESAEIELTPGITLNTLLQTRYTTTFHPGSDNARPGYALREEYIATRGDGFAVRRAYLRMNANPVDWFSARIVIDFSRFERGGLARSIRQAWGRFALLPKHLELSLGVLKLPMSIMKLDSAAELEVADAGPLTDLATELDFAGQDVGLAVMVAPFKKSKLAQFTLSAFRGHARDENASPVGAIGARLESKPIKGLRLGVSVAHHPYNQIYKQPFETSDKELQPVPSDPLYPRQQSWTRGNAWSADATFHKHGVMVRAEGMLGDRVDADERYGARSYCGAWALVAYRFTAGPVQLSPAIRAEWLDADTDHDLGERRTLSLAMNVQLNDHLRILIDATHTDVEATTPVLDPPRPLTELPYFELDHTRAVGQLQIQI